MADVAQVWCSILAAHVVGVRQYLSHGLVLGVYYIDVQAVTSRRVGKLQGISQCPLLTCRTTGLCIQHLLKCNTTYSLWLQCRNLAFLNPSCNMLVDVHFAAHSLSCHCQVQQHNWRAAPNRSGFILYSRDIACTIRFKTGHVYPLRLWAIVPEDVACDECDAWPKVVIVCSGFMR